MPGSLSPSHQADPPSQAGLSAYRFEITGGLLVIFATMLLVAVFVAIAPEPTEQQVAVEKGVLAVLPFDSVGQENTGADLAANFQDSLISSLANMSGVKVIAKSSVLAFVESQMPLHLIEQELGATAYLSGSIERDGPRVRIQARLTDTKSGLVDWTRTYDRELSSDSYFEVQSEILSGISRSLSNGFNFADQAKLSRRPKTDLGASDLFYRAKRIFELREVDNYLTATLEELEKALVIDPDYVSALSLKAHVELAQYWYASRGREWIEKADKTLKAAEALAPEDPGTMVVRGYYHYWGFRDYDKASAILERAMDLAANRSDVWELSAYVARRQGRFKETLTYLSRARELNPLDIELVTEVIETQATLGALQDTIQLGNAYLERYPDNYDLIDNMDRMWRLRGAPDRAYAVLENEVAAPNWGFYSRRTRTALLTQDRGNIERALQDLRNQSSGSVEHFLIERMFAIDAAKLSGNLEEVETLEQEIRQKVANTPFAFQNEWTPNGLWTPVDVPSYLGDTAAVEAAVRDYEMQFAPDYWQTARHWSSIASALARVGLVDASMNYIERYVTLYGPLSVLRFENNPVYRDARKSPRYQRLISEARRLLDLQTS
ncbi:MAG: hypothetical protein JJ850_07485 [Kordiimonadaceae bacterium]|nr:hypothetical protein [Kordiimonadaceae bacterium]MBO6567827.1 hypothetical protein [Kordiimonadaceae bacterium]MBO6964443.1 hypothetical protein [Kordiimonadaceae bacterium]